MSDFLLVFCFKGHGTCGFSLFQSILVLHEYVISLFGSFVSTCLSLFLYFLYTAFDCFQVFQLKFIVDNFLIADGVYASVYVCHVIIVEATKYMDDCVCFADIGKELVSQSFAFACTFHQSGDVYDFYCCRNNSLGVYQLCQCVQTFIGNSDNTYIRFDCTEGEVCRLRFCV